MNQTKIIEKNDKEFIVHISVPYRKSMLEGENIIQAALNEAGSLMTGEMLQQFDTDGSPLKIGDTK